MSLHDIRTEFFLLYEFRRMLLPHLFTYFAKFVEEVISPPTRGSYMIRENRDGHNTENESRPRYNDQSICT